VNPAHWSSQQESFAAAVLDPDAATPGFLATRVGNATASRFDVYRNNVHNSLLEALVAAFPVAVRLVSEPSFRALALAYLRTELPAGAALHDYGAGLPAFIRAWEPAASLPYLADVAALEQAWWQCYGAADAPALAMHDLGALDPAELLGRRVRLHPSTRLVCSAHPVHGIWAAHQSGDEPAAPVSWQPECVLLARPEAKVQVRQITIAQHALLAALADGATLEVAASAALECDADFDPGATLQLAITAGAIQELY
jgi:hypothetical protein